MQGGPPRDFRKGDATDMEEEQPTGEALVRKLRRRNIILAVVLFGILTPVLLLDSVYISAFTGLMAERKKGIANLPFHQHRWEREGKPERLVHGGRCVMAEGLVAKFLLPGLSRSKIERRLGRDEKAVDYPEGRKCLSYRLGECGTYFKRTKVLEVCLDRRGKLANAAIREP